MYRQFNISVYTQKPTELGLGACDRVQSLLGLYTQTYKRELDLQVVVCPFSAMVSHECTSVPVDSPTLMTSQRFSPDGVQACDNVVRMIDYFGRGPLALPIVR